METRYFVVSAPIQEFDSARIFGVRPKTITKENLEESLVRQNTVQIFTSLDEAKAYVMYLRHVNKTFSTYPKGSISKGKVIPILTINDLDSTVLQTQKQNKTIMYDKEYLEDGRHAEQTTTVNVNLSFYEANSALINKKSIVSAEFVGSQLAKMEFNLPQQQRRFK